MSIFLFLLLLGTLIIETSLFPFSLTFIVFFLLIQVREQHAPWFAFLGGVIFDLFSGRLVGISSLFFLLFVLILRRYGLKFYGARFIFQLLFLLGGMFISQLLFYHIGDWRMFVIMSFLASFVLFILKRIFPDTLPTKKKLAL